MEKCKTCEDLGVKQTLPITLICSLCSRRYCTHCWSDCNEYYATGDYKKVNGVYVTDEYGCDHCE